jgi:hypothetical protein
MVHLVGGALAMVDKSSPNRQVPNHTSNAWGHGVAAFRLMQSICSMHSQVQHDQKQAEVDVLLSRAASMSSSMSPLISCTPLPVAAVALEVRHVEVLLCCLSEERVLGE